MVGRSTPREPHASIGIRLPVSMLLRLDAEVERMRAAHPGLTLDRSAAVRSLLVEAMDARDREHGKRAPSRPAAREAAPERHQVKPGDTGAVDAGNEDSEALRARLRKAIESGAATQKDAADGCGVHRTVVQKWYAGERPLPPVLRAKLPGWLDRQGY